MKAAIALLPLLAASSRAGSLQVDIDDPSSIKAAAKVIAKNLFSYYKGDQYGQTPGILPGPPPMGDYYWWEAGALWGTYIDYWHFTLDDTYSNVSKDSMVFQSGAPAYSFMPENVTMSLGNDDQGFWGLSAMLAAEVNFQNPGADEPQWLALAQGVYNTQAAPDRHDSTCGGGLRWQIPLTNNGYNYKNAIANGIFFNMGARLARYTGNDTYAQTAVATWDWVEGVGFLSDRYDVYDGAHVEDNCTKIDKPQFSYNAAIFLQGAAFMYNYTNGADLWRDRLEGLVNRTIELFFSEGAAIEISCELTDAVQCTTDMLSFKGYLHRWMAVAAQLAPFCRDQIMAALRPSAAAAAASCDDTGVCGFRWTTGAYDGLTGAGQQMNALGALSSLLIDQPWVQPPVTANAGGSSVGNANAGSSYTAPGTPAAIRTADRAGAGILTVLALSSMITCIGWMVTNFHEDKEWIKMPPPEVVEANVAANSAANLLATKKSKGKEYSEVSTVERVERTSEQTE